MKDVFVANKRALLERKEVLDVAHEMLERFEAHLTALRQFEAQYGLKQFHLPLETNAEQVEIN